MVVVVFGQKARMARFKDAAAAQFQRLRDRTETIDTLVACSTGMARSQGGEGRLPAVLGLSESAVYLAQGQRQDLAALRVPLTAICEYRFGSFTPSFRILEWGAFPDRPIEFRETTSSLSEVIRVDTTARAVREQLYRRPIVVHKNDAADLHRQLPDLLKSQPGPGRERT